MKKLILFIGLIFSFNLVFSQVRMGYTVSQIKSDLGYDLTYEFKSFIVDGATYYYLSFATDNAWVFHYFASNEYDAKAIMAKVVPDDQGALNLYVETYNKKYVIVSSKEWKAYIGTAIYTIKLRYDDEDNYSYFIWSEE